MPGSSPLPEQRFPLRKPKLDRVLIGRNQRGQWVAMDHERKGGGLFVSRDAAFSYALAENGNRKDAVELVKKPLELNLDGVSANCSHGSDHQANGHDFQT
jgi:hypothetical protein